MLRFSCGIYNLTSPDFGASLHAVKVSIIIHEFASWDSWRIFPKYLKFLLGLIFINLSFQVLAKLSYLVTCLYMFQATARKLRTDYASFLDPPKTFPGRNFKFFYNSCCHVISVVLLFPRVRYKNVLKIKFVANGSWELSPVFLASSKYDSFNP